jgi:predicted metal-binding membrane protein
VTRLDTLVETSSPVSRERTARAVAAIVFAGSAIITWQAARGMSGGMRMPGGWEMSMMWMAMPGQTLMGAAWIFFLMWQAMMIAMMLPSSWPMLELYRRVAISTREPHIWPWQQPAPDTSAYGWGSAR